MADANEIIIQLLERLVSMAVHKIGEEVDLLRGVEKEVADLSNKLKKVKHQLDDAEEKAIQDQDIKHWLNSLETASHEMDNMLDEWEYAALKSTLEGPDVDDDNAGSQHLVCSFLPSPSSCLSFNNLSTRHRLAKKIKQLKAKLDVILRQGEKYKLVMSQPKELVRRDPTTSFVEVDDILGRDRDRKILTTKLIGNEGSSHDSHEPRLGFQTVSIVGSGGIGKTTLAQLMYNDNRVTNHYPLKIWICVSNPFDPLAIAKGIIQKVIGSRPDTDNLDTLLEHLKTLITGKKFLLVLDDVWTEESKDWEPFRVCLKSVAEGSKILVTTRKKRVAEIMGTPESSMHYIGLLTDDECWMILRRMACRESEFERFEAIGKTIAAKCNGLPLAATVLGSMLHDKHMIEGWENVLNSKTWEIKEVGDNLNPHLLLSYNELSPRALKRCFSYLSFFPQDTRLEATHVINCWLALGYLGSGSDMELRGQDYFHDLAMRSLLQDFEKDFIDNRLLVACKMHDIVHEFARSLRKGTGDNNVEATSCPNCSLPLDSTLKIKEYRSIVLEGDSPRFICDCLKNVRVLVITGSCPNGILKGVEKLIHLTSLQLNGCNNITAEDLKSVFRLYNLKILVITKSNLEEIPREIAKLNRLRHLDLHVNELLKELPETVCDLHELCSFDVSHCKNLCGLPRGIENLRNLKHLNMYNTYMENFHVPWEAVGQLTCLGSLDVPFTGRLKHLKNLNHLSRSLKLIVGTSVDDAKEAELNKKASLQTLVLLFDVGRSADDDRVGLDMLTALRPHQNLQSLTIENYGGSKLADWIVSPLNHVRKLTLESFNHPAMWQLPALGSLPCLEELKLFRMNEVRFMGRELLGITTTEDVGFPKLKMLEFWYFLAWEEWEDITPEEEVSTTLSFFPCLNYLRFVDCLRLKAIPRRLWRKVTASNKNLEVDIEGSPDLEQEFKMMMVH